MTTAFESFEFPLYVKESLFLLLSLPGLLSAVHTMFRVTKEIFRKVILRSPPGVDSQEWHVMWQKQDCFAPVVWKFSPEQLQNPNKVGEYLKEKCCGNSREVQSYAMCWALATVYQTVLHTRQHSQGEKEQGRARGTMGTPTAAEAQEQPTLGALSPIWKKTSKAKSVRLVNDEEEAGPSQQGKRQGQR